MNNALKAKLVVVSAQQKSAGIIDPVNILRTNPDHEILLLESADIVTKLGEKSMLFLDLALKIKAHGDQVVITALMSEAKALIKALHERFTKETVDFRDDVITLAIAPLYHHLDLLQKMKTRSALDVLRAVLSSVMLEDQAHKKSFMITGAFSYDFLDHFEKLPTAKVDRAGIPDYLFYLPLTLIVINHKAKKTSVIAHAISDREGDSVKEILQERLDRANKLVLSAKNAERVNFPKGPGKLSYQVDITDNDFFQLVEKCKEHILLGDVYQIVPSRTFFAPIKDQLLCYQALRHLNPSPYMFFMRTHEWTLFGASPETFIKVDKKGTRVSIRPIAGTRRRGFITDGSIDDELDSREQASLCLDEKELAEHMMLVDLARNDIASIAKPKSRRIKRLLAVDRFSHVMHLVSEVEGTIKEGFDALSAYQASMNMGTLMGAPKVRAAELLRTLEASKRGFYGGAIGYVDLSGNMDTAIIIRSALVKGDTAYIRAGCGVVHDSTPQFETKETINKAEAVLRSIALAGEL